VDDVSVEMPGCRLPYFPTDQREGWAVVGLLLVAHR